MRRRIDRDLIDGDRAEHGRIDAERLQLRLRLDAEKFAADFVMRPVAAFDQHDVAAGGCQAAGGGGARRATANDDGFHAFHFRRPMAKRNINQRRSTAFDGMPACAIASSHSWRVNERATDIRPS